jgi:hypothetical protein
MDINVSDILLPESKAMDCAAEESEFDSITEQTFPLQHSADASEARHLPLPSAEFQNVSSHNSTYPMSALRSALFKLRNIIIVPLFNL